MARQSLKDLVASSGMAFAGTVQAVGETTVQGVPVDDRMVVVRVDRRLEAPPEVEVAPGSQVTVQLSPDLPKLKVGDQATFFANPAVYGEGLMVSEVGRMKDEPAPAGGARVATREDPTSGVDQALAELTQDSLIEHARDAAVIVRGHVVRLEEAQAARAPARARPALVDRHPRGGPRGEGRRPRPRRGRAARSRPSTPTASTSSGASGSSRRPARAASGCSTEAMTSGPSSLRSS